MTASSQPAAPTSGPSDLLRQVAAPSALAAAWEHVARRGSAPGADGVTVQRWAASAQANIARISRALLSGRYAPQPVLRFQLRDKPKRDLGVVTVDDRVVARSLGRALGARIEAHLGSSAFAYRPRRSVGGALDLVDRHLAAGRRWFVRTDVARFFDRIHRDRVWARLRRWGDVPDDVLALVVAMATAGVVTGSATLHPVLGVAQGSSLSPLLSNVALAPVDEVMETAGLAYIRYADDILVLAEDRQASADALALLTRAVEGEALQLGARKTYRGHVGAGFEFLGVRFDAAGRGLTRGAWASLASLVERASGSSDGSRAQAVPGLLQLLGEWERWYGPLAPRRAPTYAALAACALTAAARGDARALADAAAARLGIPQEAAGARDVRLALLDVWQGVPGVVGQRAVLVEARGAVRLPGAAAAVAERLGLPPEVGGELVGSWKRWADVLGRHGRTALASVARTLEVGGATQGSDAGDVVLDAQGLRALLGRLEGRVGVHGIERRNARDQRIFGRVNASLDLGALRGHLAGKARRGVYLHLGDGRVRAALVEVGLSRHAELPPWVWRGEGGGVRERWEGLRAVALDHAVRMGRWALGHGLVPQLERAGDGAVRMWFFFAEAVLGHLALRLVRRVVREVGGPPEGLSVQAFPRVEAPRRGLGVCVALPCGVHPRARERGVWIDPSGEEALARAPGGPWTSWSRLLGQGGEGSREVPSWPIPVGAVLRAVVRGPVGLPAWTPGEGWASFFDSYPRARAVMGGCGMLRALALKARRLGHLEPVDRRTLIEALGHLGERERGSVLEYILEPAGVRPAKVGQALARLSPAPISCAKVRSRYAALVDEVGCSCHFTGLWGGVWPTPVLHAMRSGELPEFRRRQRAHRAARRAGRGQVASAGGQVVSPNGAGGSAMKDRADSEHLAGAEAPDLGATMEAAKRALSELLSASDGRESARSSGGEGVDGGGGPPPASGAGSASGPVAEGPVAEGPSAGAADGLGEEWERQLESVLGKRANLREQIANAERGLRRTDEQLMALFRRAGTSRLRTRLGVLVMEVGPPVRFYMEI